MLHPLNSISQSLSHQASVWHLRRILATQDAWNMGVASYSYSTGWHQLLAQDAGARASQWAWNEFSGFCTDRISEDFQNRPDTEIVSCLIPTQACLERVTGQAPPPELRAEIQRWKARRVLSMGFGVLFCLRKQVGPTTSTTRLGHACLRAWAFSLLGWLAASTCRLLFGKHVLGSLLCLPEGTPQWTSQQAVDVGKGIACLDARPQKSALVAFKSGLASSAPTPPAYAALILIEVDISAIGRGFFVTEPGGWGPAQLQHVAAPSYLITLIPSVPIV